MAQIAIGAGVGAAQGAVAGAAGGPAGMLVGALVGGALGAATGALGTLLGQQGSKRRQSGKGYIETTSARDEVVGVGFGRNRGGGNWIAVGHFRDMKDRLEGTPGRRLQRANGILAVGEGPIQPGLGLGGAALGNIRQDGSLLRALAQPEKLTVKGYFVYKLYEGTNDQDVPNRVPVGANGYADEPHVPWRNTALLQVWTVVGEKARLPEVNFDFMGPDLTVRRSGTTGGDDAADVPGYCLYDGDAERFYYTVTASADGAPFGLVSVGREDGPRLHTRPPAGVGSVIRAWYLGRHDVLVMQDPADPARFHVGHWGIDPDSDGWEAHHPDGHYDRPILAFHLDEQHGILHTLHAGDGGGGGGDDDDYLIQRWTLLTGRVEQTRTNVAAGAATAMVYAADFDCYVIADAAGLHFCDPRSGKRFKTTTAVPTAGCVGLCVSGTMVGVLRDGALEYFDPYADQTLGPYGTSGTGTGEGQLGGVAAAHWNTFTGHVTFARDSAGGCTCFNFHASVLEDERDLNANGSAGLGSRPHAKKKPEKNFQTFPEPDPDTDWVRDWSWRTPAAYDLVALEGNSSLAAAVWAAHVDEANLDSKRWGAGRPARYFSLGSLEGVHSFCVGGVLFVNPDGTKRRAERYKFDFLLAGEMPLSTFRNDHALLACQGYATVIGGRMHFGVHRAGMWPVWHFTDRQHVDDTFQLTFLGRGQGVNKVRVSYRDVNTEYRTEVAEATDDWDIRQRHRVQVATLSADGVGRQGHAELLCRAVLDQSLGGRKQADFKTHHAAFVVTPSDPVEVSDDQCALSRCPMKVTAMRELERNATVVITALEHRAALDALLSVAVGQPGPGSGDDAPPQENCDSTSGALDGSITWFNGGAAYQGGDGAAVSLTYQGGSYSRGEGWQHAVHGWQLVTRDPDGTIVVVAEAPAAAVDAPGYPDVDAAEAANQGQTVTLLLEETGPLGLRRKPNDGATGPAKDDEGEAVPPPAYELCVVLPELCHTVLYNTGQSTKSGAGGTVDRRWKVNGQPAKVTVPNDLWADPGGEAAWVSDQFNTTHPQAEDKLLTFETTVTIASDAPAVAASGAFSVDNQVLDILVNGNATGQGYTADETGFYTFHGFSLTEADGLVRGENTVTFQVKQVGHPVENDNPRGFVCRWDDPCRPSGCDGGGLPSSVAVDLSGVEFGGCTWSTTPAPKRCKDFAGTGTAWDGVLAHNPNPISACFYRYSPGYAPNVPEADRMLVDAGDGKKIWLLLVNLEFRENVSEDAGPGWRLLMYCVGDLGGAYTYAGGLFWHGVKAGDGPPTGVYTRKAGSTCGPPELTVV